MFLKEKHVTMLDGMPYNQWVSIHDVKKEKGITGGTFRALTMAGIIKAVIVLPPDHITDTDIAAGGLLSVVRPVKKDYYYGNIFVKKIKADYRTRDYELMALRATIKEMERKINTLENNTAKKI